MSSQSLPPGGDTALADLSRLSLYSRLALVLRTYLPLGFTSFGGPGVHVVILRRLLVDRLRWVDERTFVDLFALGNALPGPGSTQLAFSIAVVTLGVLSGLVAFLCWSLPGAIGMAALAAGIGQIPPELPGLALALLSGLNAAAVGLIALAAVQLGTSSATDRVTLLLVWLSAGAGICYHAPWMYPTLIVAGGVTTVAWDFRRSWLLVPLRRVRGRRAETRLRSDATLPDTAVDGESRDETWEMDRLTPGDTSRENPRDLDTSPSTISQHAYPSPPASPTPTRLTRPTPALARPNENLIQRHSTLYKSIDARTPAPLVLPTDPSHPQVVAASDAVTSRPVDAEHASPDVPGDRLKVVSARAAYGLIAGFACLLIIPLATRAGLARAGGHVARELDFFANMILAGTIIFGGGPVVIPLLRDYVVAPGWVSSRDFLLIFAILQAFPGPNFNFAVALGFLTMSSSATYSSASHPVFGALLGFIGIFSPGIILKLGLLPLYSSWRDKSIARSIIRGLNAAAAGLVYTAVWQLFLVGYVYVPATGTAPSGSAGASGDKQTISGPLTLDPFWAVVASGAFLACRNYQVPPWGSILAGGVAGLAWYGVRNA